MRRRGAKAGLVLIAGAAIAIAPASWAGKGDDQPDKPRKGPTIKVEDDFFAPADVSVRANTKISFKWSSENSNPHNVTATKVPKGVKKKDFKSATGSIGIKFAPVFEKKGTYDLLCTIHPTVMTMKVTVKK